MEQITKKMDDKLFTISKMQASLHNKRIDYSAFLSGNHLELPPISNVLVSFPTATQKVGIKNTPQRKKIAQIDKLLENYSTTINADELNRIIFANPTKNRIIFQRTFFRSSIYYSIGDKKNKNSHKAAKSMEETQQQGKLRFTPIKIKQQNQKIQQVKNNTLSEPLDKTSKPTQAYSNMFNSNIESILEKRKKDRGFRKGNEFKLPKASLNLRVERYSPWKNDELEEQLIL